MQPENNFSYYDKNNVAGVVVLYEPDLFVIENILSYLNQISFLFVVDNSENTAPFITNFVKTNSSRLEYTFNGANLGVAAALNLGAQKAIKAGYSFLLTMDQDSKAPSGMVNPLLEKFKTGSKIALVSPLHSNKFNTHIENGEDNFQVKSVMTSGNLLSLDAFRKIGGFCEDFFIDYVDIEYCFRLNHNNYNILQVNSIVLHHNEANLSEKKIFSKKIYPQNHSPFRMYYKSRNLLFLRGKYKSVYPAQLKHEFNLYIRIVLKIILFEKHKIRKVKMILLGVFDYLKGEKGRKF